MVIDVSRFTSYLSYLQCCPSEKDIAERWREPLSKSVSPGAGLRGPTPANQAAPAATPNAPVGAVPVGAAPKPPPDVTHHQRDPDPRSSVMLPERDTGVAREIKPRKEQNKVEVSMDSRVAVISSKIHKRQSVTAIREKSQTPKVLTAILT